MFTSPCEPLPRSGSRLPQPCSARGANGVDVHVSRHRADPSTCDHLWRDGCGRRRAESRNPPIGTQESRAIPNTLYTKSSRKGSIFLFRAAELAHCNLAHRPADPRAPGFLTSAPRLLQGETGGKDLVRASGVTVCSGAGVTCCSKILRSPPIEFVAGRGSRGRSLGMTIDRQPKVNRRAP